MTSNQMNKKTFYEIVLDEFNESHPSYHIYLCARSSTFRINFSYIKDKHVKIVEHANEYLKNSKYEKYFKVCKINLRKKIFDVGLFEFKPEFIHEIIDDLNIEYFVRLDFINYCIANNYDL